MSLFSTEFHRISQNFTKFHKISQNFTKFHKIYNMKWLYRNDSDLYTISQKFTEFSRILQNFTEIITRNESVQYRISLQSLSAVVCFIVSAPKNKNLNKINYQEVELGNNLLMN